MTVLAATAFALCALLGALGFGPELARRLRRRRARTAARKPAARPTDPGRELRAERKALELLRSVLGAEPFEMYRQLGFVLAEASPDHAYVIYPHRPLVSYDPRSGELLAEHCVTFPERSDGRHGERLPDADDVLAKWLSVTGHEARLMSEANMHLPGRQLDPALVRRDLRRAQAWRGARRAPEATAG